MNAIGFIQIYRQLNGPIDTVEDLTLKAKVRAFQELFQH